MIKPAQLLTVLCAFLVQINGAQSQLITIIDSETKAPISNVEIIDFDTKALLKTDENGQIERSLLSSITKIEFKSIGYKTKIIPFSLLLNEGGTTVSLQLNGVSHNDVVYSAGRFEHRQADVPQKIQVIRGSEIQRMNQSSTADIIGNSGNIMVQKSQLGGGSPIMRGFTGNKIVLMIDGVRMNNTIYGSDYRQNCITVDNSILDRMELSFGNGSTQFGSDAIGGVISFFTKNPTLATNQKIATKVDSYVRYRTAAKGMTAHADISVGSKKFGSLSSFTYSDFGDLRQGYERSPFNPDFGKQKWYSKTYDGKDFMIQSNNSGLQRNSGYSQYDFLQKFLFQPSKNVSHGINLQYSTSSDIPNYGQLNLLAGNTAIPKYAVWNYGPQNRLLAAYNFKLTKKTKLFDQLKITAAYQQVEESRIIRLFKNPNLNQQDEKVDVLSLNADFEKKMGNHRLFYGLEVINNKVKSTGKSTNIETDIDSKSPTYFPDGGAEMSSYAAYISHSWNIVKWLTFTDGVRVSNSDLVARFSDKTFYPLPFDKAKTNNSALSGNLGLVFKLKQGWRASMNVSSAYRNPNLDDLRNIYSSAPGKLIILVPDLQPEYSFSYEVEVSKTFNDRITFSALAYVNYLSNIISLQQGQYNGFGQVLYNGQLSQVYKITNAGTGRIFGAEGRLAGNLNEFFTLFTTFNFIHTETLTNYYQNQKVNSPPIFGKLGINFSQKKWKCDFFLNYSGWKKGNYAGNYQTTFNYTNNEKPATGVPLGMPSWYTMNIRCAYDILNSLSVQVAWENMFDQNYRIYDSNISAPGRNFIATLRYKL